MKALIAMDSFKGTLSSKEVNHIVQQAFSEEGFDVITKAVADGGEGSVDALLNNGAESLMIPSVNSYFEPMDDIVAYMPHEKTAFIEVAHTIGLQFNDAHHSPEQLSSYGVGLTIRHVITHYDVTRIVLMLGGTGTIDAGIGLGEALGVRYYNHHHQLLTHVTGQTLSEIAFVDDSALNEYQHITFELGHDVTAKLTGEYGAVYGFGKQKGVVYNQLSTYESWMNHFRMLTRGNEQEGDGAAGGLGYFCRHFLHATAKSGFDYIAHYGQFSELKDCDIVITGEGCCDQQSLLGKLPMQVAQYFQRPTFLLVGQVPDASIIIPKPIVSIYPITLHPCTLDEAMTKTTSFLYYTAKQLAKTLILRSQ